VPDGVLQQSVDREAEPLPVGLDPHRVQRPVTSDALLWLQFTGSRPLSPALTPLRRVMLVAGTITVGTLLGMVLVFGYGLAYPAYLGGGQHVQSVVSDQQTGGAVLWVLMLPAYVTVGIALLIRWLNDEESQALTAGFDRLLKPAKSAWPSRPGL